MLIVTIIIIIVSIILLPIVLLYAFGVCNKCTNVKCNSQRRLDGKTCIVTGGTTGMGLEIATEFIRRGAKVLIACPFQEEGTAAKKTIAEATGKDVIFKLLNLSSLASVRTFAEDFLRTEDRLDILINNAGVLRPDKLTNDGMNFVMQVNYFGPFLLTLLLLPLLKKTGKISEPSIIVNTSSCSHVMGNVDFKKLNKTGYKFTFPIYFNSKLCVAMFTRELAMRLANTNVVVHTADPGIAVTSIVTGYGKCAAFMKIIFGKCYPSAWEGAQTALHLALDPKAIEDTGQYYKNCKLRRAGSKAHDDAKTHRLWEESVELVKLSNEEVHSAFQGK